MRMLTYAECAAELRTSPANIRMYVRRHNIPTARLRIEANGHRGRPAVVRVPVDMVYAAMLKGTYCAR